MGSHRKNKTPNSSQKRLFFLVPPNDASVLDHVGNRNGNSNHAHPDSTAVMEGNESHNNRYEYDDEDNTVRALDFGKVLQDVEGSLVGTMASSVVAITGLLSSTQSSNGASFRVTWKELLYLVFGIVVLACLSIFMGVAAGITISIHYFDTHNTPSFPRLEARERDLGPHQHVTTLDYSIASSNLLHTFIGTTLDDEKSMDLMLGRVITMSESGQRSVLFVVQETPPLKAAGNKTNSSSLFDACENDATLLQNVDRSELLLGSEYRPYRYIGPPDSKFQMTASKVHPTICSDGVTIGYNDWDTLKSAVEEANALSAECFMRWNEYFASLDGSTTSSDWFDILPRTGISRGSMSCSNKDDSLLRYYYDEDIVFTICPGSTLKARRGPIFINAENIQIECGDPEENSHAYFTQQASSSPKMQSSFSRKLPTCTLDVGGTHLAFGPHAKNVLVRGLVFQSAKTSSLAFHYAGAQASFEDCIWFDNVGVHGKYGAVADVNSSSIVNFHRCEIGSSLAKIANMAGAGGGKGGQPIGGGDISPNGMPNGYFGTGIAPGFSSFFSLRN